MFIEPWPSQINYKPEKNKTQMQHNSLLEMRLVRWEVQLYKMFESICLFSG